MRVFIGTILVIIFAQLGAAQSININVIVNPPYSPYYEDYLQYDNKVTLILSNTSASEKEIYLHGKIASDNGIEAQTKDGYRPIDPLIIAAGGLLQLTGGDLEEYLHFDNVNLEGIREQDLVNADGLPEGNYQICVQAFDWNTDEPLSEAAPFGCSANIPIQHIDPPFIVNPICEEVVIPIEPQNMVFTWSVSPGALPNTQYLLQITEILPGQDAEDAMLALLNPPFFEVEVSGNSYIYGVADPELEMGQKYAVRVQSFDPFDEKVYRNNGFSEVCSFTYGTIPDIDEETAVLTPFTYTPNDDIYQYFEDLNNTSVSGKLLYKYKNNASTITFFPSMSFDFSQLIPTPNPSLGAGYTNFQSAGSYGAYLVNSTNTNSWNSYSYNGDGFVNTGSVIGGNPLGDRQYLFENTASLSGGKPLGNTRLKLVLFYVFIDNSGGSFENREVMYSPPFLPIPSDINGSPINWPEQPSSRLVATTTTEEDGSYRFDFHIPDRIGYIAKLADVPGELHVDATAGGQVTITPTTLANNVILYTCLKVVVDDDRFYSPDIDIFAQPGDQISIPDQVSYVNDYTMEVQVKAEEREALFAGSGNILENAELRIMRNQQQMYIKKELRESEGQQLSTFTTDNHGEFKDVAVDLSDKDGIAFVNHLTKSRQGDPFYMMRIQTRNAVDQNTYENTLYNYKPHYEEISYASYGITGARTAVFFDGMWDINPNFNRDYTADTLHLVKELEALLPEIKGRVMETSDFEAIGLAGVKVKLLNQTDYGPASFWHLIFGAITPELWPWSKRVTSEDGFYRFTHLPVNINNGVAAGPFRRLFFDKYGYEKQYINPFNMMPWNLAYGELKDIKDVFLVPMGEIKGKIVDEDGLPVECLVKVGDGAAYKTELANEGGGGFFFFVSRFKMLAEAGQNVPLVVTPLSDDYLPKTFYININQMHQGEVQDVGSFTMLKRERRSLVHVMDINGNPIHGASVSIDEYAGTTNSQGNVRFSFKNAKEWYRLKVTYGEILVPIQKSVYIANGEEQQISVILYEGKTITGKIGVEGVRGAVADAKISVLINVVDGYELRKETTSDASGNYTLHGLPAWMLGVNVTVSTENNDPNKDAYIGITEQVGINSAVTHKDFYLKRVSGWRVTNIWGFPVSFTEMSNYSGNSVTVAGYFYSVPILSPFSKTDPNLKIHFSGLKMVKNSSGVWGPASTEIRLNTSGIPLMVQGKFPAKLWNVPSLVFQADNRLTLKKDGNGQGYIAGLVELTTTPFSSKLYTGFGNTHPGQTVFAPNSGFSIYQDLFVFEVLGNQVKPIRNLDIYGFKASSPLAESKMVHGEIVLSPRITVSLPLSNPSEIPISLGQIKATKSDIIISSTAFQMPDFKLEQWEIKLKEPLTFNNTSRYFVLPKVELDTKTGIRVNIENLMLHDNELKGGIIKLSGGLSMAGVADLTIDPSVIPTFNYDQGTGHYRVNLASNSENYVGHIDNLDGLDGQSIQFKSIGLQSNNVNPISISQSLRLYNIMDFDVSQLLVGEDFFTLAGSPRTGIPGEEFQSGQLKFTRDGNKVKTELIPLVGQIHMKGRVDFVLDKTEHLGQGIQDGEYWSYGDIIVRPGETDMGASPFILRGYLKRTISGTIVEVINTESSGMWKGSIHQLLSLGADDSYYTVLEGSAIASNTNWDKLHFDAKPQAYDGMDDANKMTFIIHGAVEAGGDGLKVDNIDVGFGELSMIYDFNEQSLEGGLTITEPITMGFASINSGVLKMRFDKNGYYIALGANLNIVETILVSGGILVGNSSIVRQEHIHAIHSNFGRGGSMLPGFSKIKGIFIGGQREVFDFNFPAGVFVVSGQAGAGTWFTLDFSEGTRIDVGGYAFASASSSLDVGVCDFCFGLEGLARITGEYSSNSGLTFAGCGSLQLDINACVDDFSGSAKLQLSYNSNANKFEGSFGLGSCANGNSGQQADICPH